MSTYNSPPPQSNSFPTSPDPYANMSAEDLLKGESMLFA